MGTEKSGTGTPSMIDEKHLLAFVGIVVLYRIFEWFREWVREPDHLILTIGSMISFAVAWVVIGFTKLKRNQVEREREKAILANAPGAVLCGETENKEAVYVKPRQRAMHTQVIGTTNAGKTESVILPWAIQDIQQGRGLLLIDGKADGSLLSKLWSYTVKAKRADDFRLVSLGHLPESSQFNPLLGGTAEEVTERVFNAFEFENPHYRALQYEVMGQTLRILESAKGEGAPKVATFQRLHQLISQPEVLKSVAWTTDDEGLKAWAEHFCDLSKSDREQRTVGLLSALGQFAFGTTAPLFNAEKNVVTIDDALSKNLIVYFQLPVLLSPFLGRAAGKLVLQSLQAAVANRHRSSERAPRFFSVFLDDFSEYLYPGFVSILNKSRSANVGIVFAHQALGDITALGDSVANAILTNSNLKVFMRGNDPQSAEYFSKVIGTRSSRKYTERETRKWFGTTKTGETSVREVEEFVIHPNAFKRDLGVGQAIMLVPHDQGTKTIRLRFNRLDDLPNAPILPVISKEFPAPIPFSKRLSEKPRADATPIDELASHNKQEVA